MTQVCPDPPVVSFCGSVDPRSKDSVVNAKTTKGYTINIISEAWSEQSNMAAIDAPPNVSEWELSGLTKEPSVSNLLMRTTPANRSVIDLC